MTLAELNTQFRNRLRPADAPQTWTAAMAGVCEALFDREYSDAAFAECNRLASLTTVPEELRGRVPDWSELLPLLRSAHDANLSTASNAPPHVRSLLMKMGAAADAV